MRFSAYQRTLQKKKSKRHTRNWLRNIILTDIRITLWQIWLKINFAR